MSTVTYLVQNILKEYGQNDYYELLKEANSVYEELTGKCHPGSDDYEARMNSFNDWYVFHYRPENEKKIFVRYFDDHGIATPMAKSFYNVNFSVFKVTKAIKGKIYLYDILHDEKIKILEEDSSVGLVPEDLFVGRIVEFEEKFYLLKGVCTIPRESFSEIDKYCKSFRKRKLYNLENKFLLNLEKLKVKSLNYKHLTSDKIFNIASLEINKG